MDFRKRDSFSKILDRTLYLHFDSTQKRHWASFENVHAWPCSSSLPFSESNDNVKPRHRSPSCVAIANNGLQRSEESRHVWWKAWYRRLRKWYLGWENTDLTSLLAKQMLGTCPSVLAQRHPTGFHQIMCHQTQIPRDAETQTTHPCLLLSPGTRESCLPNARKPLIDGTPFKKTTASLGTSGIKKNCRNIT